MNADDCVYMRSNMLFCVRFLDCIYATHSYKHMFFEAKSQWPMLWNRSITWCTAFVYVCGYICSNRFYYLWILYYVVCAFVSHPPPNRNYEQERKELFQSNIYEFWMWHCHIKADCPIVYTLMRIPAFIVEHSCVYRTVDGIYVYVCFCLPEILFIHVYINT